MRLDWFLWDNEALRHLYKVLVVWHAWDTLWEFSGCSGSHPSWAFEQSCFKGWLTTVCTWQASAVEWNSGFPFAVDMKVSCFILLCTFGPRESWLGIQICFHIDLMLHWVWRKYCHQNFFSWPCKILQPLQSYGAAFSACRTGRWFRHAVLNLLRKDWAFGHSINPSCCWIGIQCCCPSLPEAKQQSLTTLLGNTWFGFFDVAFFKQVIVTFS